MSVEQNSERGNKIMSVGKILLMFLTLGSHSTAGSLIQDNIISCQASPVDDLKKIIKFE